MAMEDEGSALTALETAPTAAAMAVPTAREEGKARATVAEGKASVRAVATASEALAVHNGWREQIQFAQGASRVERADGQPTKQRRGPTSRCRRRPSRLLQSVIGGAHCRRSSSRIHPGAAASRSAAGAPASATHWGLLARCRRRDVRKRPSPL
jgi:hypothetical protein